MRDYAGLERELLSDLGTYLSGEAFISSDMTVSNVNALSLAASFYKKLCPLNNTQKADDAALKKFMQINDRMGSYRGFVANDEVESTFWDYFKNNVQECLGFEVEGVNYDLSFIAETMNVGPGAAQKAVGTDFLSKLFEGPISYTTERLIPLYRSALTETGLWAEAELLRSSRFPFVKVEGGKLFFAKKNAEISRTCCTPANLNLLIQMSCGAFIEQRLEKYFGISLSTQPDLNAELARIGSIDGTFGTIDLVSASDSNSVRLCNDLRDGSLLWTCIFDSRDRFAVLPNGDEVELNMLSTMGNGYTFPLQTLIFASAVKACYEMMGMRPTVASAGHPSRTRFGVFGDDIIVHKSVYNFICRMLTKLGFEVNEAKSFNTGPFRESCGSDYFRGTNVRGVYIKSLEAPQQVFSAINRLIRWSTRTGILLKRTISCLRSWVRVYLVPPSMPDDSGVHVPCSMTIPRLDGRYWYRFRYYRRLTKSVLVERQSELDKRPVFKNELGIGCGYLAGYLRRRDLSLSETNHQSYLMDVIDVSVKISIRDPVADQPRFRLQSDSIPFWDWPGLSNHWGNVNSDELLQIHNAWESTVMASLCVSSG